MKNQLPIASQFIAILPALVVAAQLISAQAAPERVVYKTIDGRKLTLDINFPPKGKSTTKRPAIVFFFGGGWRAGTPAQFRPQAEYFAKRGLVCFRADYRVRSRDGVLPNQCVEDAISAMKWVRQHAAEFGVDPNRIVAAGGSAGGHLAACTFFAGAISSSDAAPSVSAKPNAMILYNPVVDLTPLPGTRDGNLVKGLSAEMLKRISPSAHVRRDMPPTLIIDGTADRFNGQIRKFVAKCHSVGAPVEAVYTTGQRHGFFNRPPWLEKTTQEADAFLQRIGYLGKEPHVPLPNPIARGKKSH